MNTLLTLQSYQHYYFLTTLNDENQHICENENEII